MCSPRYLKLYRDIRTEKNKFILMVAAIALSLTGVGAVLGAYTILSREIDKNYVLTLPASATLEMDGSDAALAEAVRARPGIAAAEERTTVTARIRSKSGTWEPLLLFVIGNFSDMTLARFTPETGEWPPSKGTLLLERQALDLYGVNIADAITVRIPEGKDTVMTVSGSVHDPSLAPAWQGGIGYAYVTRETYIAMGGNETANELKIIFGEKNPTIESVTESALVLADWLTAGGRTVTEIQVPPPSRHPHQAQLTALLTLLFVFSLCALVLGSILSASVISAILVKETRNIGIMKAIGAGGGQIACLYALLVVTVSAAAMLFGMPLGLFLGRGFAGLAAEMLNVTLYSSSVPGWVYAVQIGAGFFIPLLIALVPISSAIRRTPCEALRENGVRKNSFAPRKPSPISVLLGKADRSFILTIRNAFRRRNRLILTLTLLASAGSMFMMTLNVNKAWDYNLTESFKARNYDFDVRLSKNAPIAETSALLMGIPGVLEVEGWGLAAASRAVDGGIEVTHSYPDGGHGMLSLIGVPSLSSFVEFPVAAGAWLDGETADQAVLNPQGLSLLGIPNAKIGDRIRVSSGGRAKDWQISGIVNEVGMAAIYVNESDFARALSSPGLARSFRIVSRGKSDGELSAVIREIESALAGAGIGVSSVIADGAFRSEVVDHIVLLILALLSMAVIMAAVGLLGLASAVGTGVIERKREFGVMRAIGALPGTLVRNVIGESVFIAIFSLILALAASFPLSYVIGGILGKMAFDIPLGLVVSGEGILIWLGLIFAGSIASGAIPAVRAAGTTVREALAYE